MLMKKIILIVFIFSVLVISGCGTVKGVGSGFAYTLQGVCDDTVNLGRMMIGRGKINDCQTCSGVKKALTYTANGMEIDANSVWQPISKTDNLIKDNLW